MNDLLIVGGVGCLLVGCYLIMPAAALVAGGLLLIAVGLVRIKGQHGPG